MALLTLSFIRLLYPTASFSVSFPLECSNYSSTHSTTPLLLAPYANCLNHSPPMPIMKITPSLHNATSSSTQLNIRGLP
jgi:hypothetical protein